MSAHHVLDSPKKSSILAERSPNTQSPAKTKTASSPGGQCKDFNLIVTKPKTAEMNPHELANAQAQTYISPSDNILSPTTKKLSEIKGKRFMNSKPRSLFAKTVSKEGLRSQERLNSASKADQ